MKKTAILIIDKDRRIREKIDFLKLRLKLPSAPTMSAVIRLLVNQAYDKIKNPK